MFNKKRGKAFLTMLLLMASLGLAACSQNREAEADTTTEAAQSEVESETTAEQAQSETESATKAEETDSAEEPSEEADDTLIRVGSLKGPTTIGLVNMMQAAHALGLGSVWINAINRNDEKASNMTSFSVPSGYRVYGCLALGYPDGGLRQREVKDASETVSIIE